MPRLGSNPQSPGCRPEQSLAQSIRIVVYMVLFCKWNGLFGRMDGKGLKIFLGDFFVVIWKKSLDLGSIFFTGLC